MKHRWIVLATSGILILCILTFGLLSIPSSLTAPAVPERAEPPLRLLADTRPETPAAAAEQTSPPPLAEPAQAGAQPAQTEDGVVTGPDGCVLLGAPHQVSFLPEAGMALMTNGGGLYAFDTASGKLAWHRYVASEQGYRGSALGSKHVLTWFGDDLRLLEIATGREAWAQSNAAYGPVQRAQLSRDDSRVAVSTEKQFVVYSTNGADRRVIARYEHRWVWSWLSDSLTLLTLEQKGEGGKMAQVWRSVNSDTGETLGTWERSAPFGFVSRPSKQDQLVEESKTDEKDAKGALLRIRDAHTGNVVREFRTDEQVTYASWLGDGRQFWSVREDRSAVCVIDSETGKTDFALSKEGHRFSRVWVHNEDSDREFAVSQDDACDWYAWPLAPDAAPRKILSGRGIAEGGYYLRDTPAEYIVMDRTLEPHQWVHTVYAIANMRKLAEWRVRGDEERIYDSMVNRNMTRLVRWYPIDPTNGASPWNWKNVAFSAYARNSEAPFFTGQGCPIGISPDGKYLAVQNGNVTVNLYDLDAGLAAQESQFAGGRSGRTYCSAVFSDDGSRMALMGSGKVEVTDLAEGYPRRMLDIKEEDHVGWRFSVSPDGSRVLCSGPQKARLFDADTGALLRTFEETERFAQMYGGGFWNGLTARAGDWMGSVSDRFKTGAHVDSMFAEHGTRVITCAAGQVIRVWDAESGKLLHTIHTDLPEQRNRNGSINNRIQFSPNGCCAFSFNMDGYGTSSLWSLSDGALLRRYRMPEWENSWARTLVLDDASGVYLAAHSNLYRWPGILAGSSHALVEGAGN